MKTKYLNEVSPIPIILAIVVMGSTAHAQDAGPAAQPDQPAATSSNSVLFEEVVVTAQKRQESLQEIPFSIAAKGGGALTREGATGFGDYLNSIPGVGFQDLGPGLSQLNVRGASAAPTARDHTNRKEGVGVYFDEAPVSLALFNPDLDTFDIERVEVLRGPQGTLYGAGSLSGTVRIITKKPTPDVLEGAVEGGISTTKDGGMGFSLKGAVNVPLSDNTAIRAVAYHNDYAGFIDRVELVSPTLGVISPGEKDTNSGAKYGGRLTLRSEGESLTSTVGVIYQKIEANGLPLDDIFNTNDEAFTGITGASLPQTGKLEQIRPTADTNDDEFLMITATLEYMLDGYDIVSTTSYIDRSIVTNRDQTLRAVSWFGVDPGRIIPQSFNDNNDVKNITQELRLVSNNDGPFQWIAGGFYQKQDRAYHQIGLAPGMLEFTGIDAVNDFGGVTPDATFDFFIDVELQQIAAFGEATYDITDKLKATVGLRYFDFKEDFKNEFRGFFSFPATRVDASASENGFNPRFIVSYDVAENVTLSAQASRGFRLGSSNPPVPETAECSAAFSSLGIDPPAEFKSEKLWNYEVGVKSKLADDRVTLNAAAYRINYTDVHLFARIDTCAGGLSFVSNAGEATSTGVEIDSTIMVTDNIKLDLGYSYTDAELSSTPPEFVLAALGPLEKGDRLPGSPDHSFHIAVDAEYPVANDYDIYLHASYTYTGSSFTELADKFNSNLLSAKRASYGIANVRLGIISGSGWDGSVYVNNLTNELAELGLDREGGGAGRQSYFRNRPRTIGANLRRSF